MSPAARILVAAGAVVVLLGGLTIGGLTYVGYRASRQLREFKTAYAVATPVVVKIAGNGCPLLDARDASRLLDIAISRAESHAESTGDTSCDFYTTPRQRQLAEMAAGLARQYATGVKAGIAGPGDNLPILTVRVKRAGGRQAWQSLAASHSALHEVSGVGDKAAIELGGQTLFVLKGDALVNLTFGLVPGAEKAAAVAGRVVAQL